MRVQNSILLATHRPDHWQFTVDACVLDAGRDLALSATAPCGTCTSVSGGATASATLPLQAMYLKGVRYEISRVHARATAPAVLDLVSAGGDGGIRSQDRVRALSVPASNLIG